MHDRLDSNSENDVIDAHPEVVKQQQTVLDAYRKGKGVANWPGEAVRFGEGAVKKEEDDHGKTD